MATALCQEILEQAGPEGRLACTCGREHRLATRRILLGEGALERSAALLRSGGDRRVPWVLSDERTEAAAGARWKAACGGTLRARVLPGAPRPVPAEALVAGLAAEVRAAAPDLLVAIGSGVVSDLVKRLSLETGVASWCVATAPSVDAYTSATAAIRVGGAHRALPARPSEVVVCDLGVLRAAPRPLLLAGLGDLLAKFLARLDWSLSHALTGEPFCETVAGWALESARQALRAAGTLERDPVGAGAALADAVLVSGLAMQALGSSRPAASAEHTIAHHWEAVDAVGDEALALHGLQVGVASRLVLGAYRALYGHLRALELDVARRLEAAGREPPWREVLEEAMRPFEGKIAEEQRGRAHDPGALARRLELFLAQRSGLLATAAPLLAELGEAVEVLDRLGFPFAPAALGLGPEACRLPLRHVRLLRARYTGFDLAHDLGCEAVLLAGAEAMIGG
jgi:glycerol-1-phosphate dehydrogenase [NAD(P)+]